MVDDDAIPRDVVSKYLMADGHEVVTAASGIEALAKLTEENFDLLLTDHAMAGMNGLQLASLVKKMPGGQRVILMTASHEVASALEENGGVDLVLRKPNSAKATSPGAASTPRSRGRGRLKFGTSSGGRKRS